MSSPPGHWRWRVGTSQRVSGTDRAVMARQWGDVGRKQRFDRSCAWSWGCAENMKLMKQGNIIIYIILSIHCIYSDCEQGKWFAFAHSDLRMGTNGACLLMNVARTAAEYHHRQNENASLKLKGHKRCSLRCFPTEGTPRKQGQKYACLGGSLTCTAFWNLEQDVSMHCLETIYAFWMMAIPLERY